MNTTIVQLDENAFKKIESIMKKLATEHNISNVSSVSISLSQNQGVTQFTKVAEKDKLDSLEDKIINFFKKNPYPEDAKVHQFADKLGIKHDKLESEIYKILCSFICEGKSKEYKGSFDEKELELGVKVEMEHTSNKDIAERIAKDHLSEFGGKYYYTALKMLEDLLKEFTNGKG